MISYQPFYKTLSEKKMTEQTTAVTTTKKQENTTKKSQTKTETTTKKSENKTTTTKPSKKPAQQTTTTTAHKHDYKPVYKTEKVKVKDAYDEPEYKEVQAFYCSGCGIECVTASKKYGLTGAQAFHVKHIYKSKNDGIVPLCSSPNIPNVSMVSGKTLGKPTTVKIQTGTVHHDAVYEDRKIVDYYKCSCGATKK